MLSLSSVIWSFTNFVSLSISFWLLLSLRVA
jgi:hypothetical protein